MIGRIGMLRLAAPAAAVLMLLSACSAAPDPVAAVGASTAAASTASDACGLIDDSLVMHALGTATRADVGGPTMLGETTCNWRNTNPNCFLRSLSAEIRSGERTGVDFAALDETAWKHVTIDGLGDRAFSSAEELPVGAAIEIHHLDVLAGDTWLRFTLSGRIQSESSRRLLKEIAAAALA